MVCQKFASKNDISVKPFSNVFTDYGASLLLHCTLVHDI